VSPARIPQQYTAPSLATPQVRYSPALTRVKRTGPPTAVGVRLHGYMPHGRAPLPPWPWSLTPQQYTTPSVATPHVVPLHPEIAVKRSGVTISRGVPDPRVTSAGAPRLPSRFSPQQKTRPSVARAQVWAFPTDSAFTGAGTATRSGKRLHGIVLS